MSCVINPKLDMKITGRDGITRVDKMPVKVSRLIRIEGIDLVRTGDRRRHDRRRIAGRGIGQQIGLMIGARGCSQANRITGNFFIVAKLTDFDIVGAAG